MAFNTTINTSLLTTYLIKKFIPTLEAELQFQKFTTPAIIPEGGGKIGRFNVFSNIPATSTPLVEGATTGNAITTLTTTGTDCTIAEYGEYLQVTQLESLAAVKGTRDALSKRFAFGGAYALDSLVRVAATHANTGTTFYCGNASVVGGSTTAAIPGSGSASALIGAAKLLRYVTTAGEPNTMAQGFSGKSGHADGDFAALVSPQFEATMVTEGTTGRMTWGQANTNVGGAMGQEKVIKGRMGAVYGTTCYRTQNFSQVTVTSLSDINYLLADGGVGAVAFGDMKPTIIVNDLNSPYKNVDTVAWHAYFGTALVDAKRVIKMYSNAV